MLSRRRIPRTAANLEDTGDLLGGEEDEDGEGDIYHDLVAPPACCSVAPAGRGGRMGDAKSIASPVHGVMHKLRSDTKTWYHVENQPIQRWYSRKND